MEEKKKERGGESGMEKGMSEEERQGRWKGGSKARTLRLSKIPCVTSACTIKDQRRQKALSTRKSKTVVSYTSVSIMASLPSLLPALLPSCCTPLTRKQAPCPWR
jgi:hypothetical protein